MHSVQFVRMDQYKLLQYLSFEMKELKHNIIYISKILVYTIIT